MKKIILIISVFLGILANASIDEKYGEDFRNLQKGMVVVLLNEINIQSGEIAEVKSAKLGHFIDGRATDRVAFIYSNLEIAVASKEIYCKAYFPFGSLWTVKGMKTMGTDLTCVNSTNPGDVVFKASIDDKTKNTFDIKVNKINKKIGTLTLNSESVERLVKSNLEATK